MALEFTGERFTPECVREIWYEHYHRYAFARPFARGKKVLDAACGEGYGSALLASIAGSVVGADASSQAIAHAREAYRGLSNTTFVERDLAALDLPDASFDLVVSFETIEHLHEQEAMLRHFKRVLGPAGLLIISSPDKETYSDARGYRNEYHVRELYRREFQELLSKFFPAIAWFGQKLLFQSAIWPMESAARQIAIETMDKDGVGAPRFDYAPLYHIAVCAQEARYLPQESEGLVSLFGDREESVYKHYEHEIKKNMQAGAVLADMERKLAESEREVAALRDSPEKPGMTSWMRILDRLGIKRWK